MPGMDLPAPATPKIDLTQHLTERQDAVITAQIELFDLVGRGQAAMMRIVKEKEIAPAVDAVLTNPPHQFGCVPFMHKHDIGVLEGIVQIESIEPVLPNLYARNEACSF